MVQGGNADSKLSEKKMEVEDSVRTIGCLRGRLLAERVASKNAKEEADKLENRLIELEKLLKEEAKSRNRAERKLKYLVKKVESMNIGARDVSDVVSEHSGPVDKSDISSVSSTSSSFAKLNLQQNCSQIGLLTPSSGNSTTDVISISELEASLPEFKGQECELGSNDTTSFATVSDMCQENVAKSAVIKEGEKEQPGQVESNQCPNDSKQDQHSEGEHRQDYVQDPENITDNSMALVLVEMPKKNEETSIDPEVLDATVREVLDALRHAKEQLQSSMERRRLNMIRVG